MTPSLLAIASLIYFRVLVVRAHNNTNLAIRDYVRNTPKFNPRGKLRNLVVDIFSGESNRHYAILCQLGDPAVRLSQNPDAAIVNRD